MNEQNDDKTNLDVCALHTKFLFFPYLLSLNVFKARKSSTLCRKKPSSEFRLPDGASTLPWSLCLRL